MNIRPKTNFDVLEQLVEQVVNNIVYSIRRTDYNPINLTTDQISQIEAGLRKMYDFGKEYGWVEEIEKSEQNLRSGAIET